MLIMSAKLPRRALTLGALVVALALCAPVLTPVFSAALPTLSEEGIPSPKGVRSNDDRVEYLSAYGWEVVPDPIATEELIIPEEMDESYQDYLTLQLDQGFDLTRYAGKRLKRYTYQITNYPTGEEGVQANLLIRRNTVVGGEVLSPQMDGFIHGLKRPEG